MEAAEKFCLREKISKDNIKQIRDWIIKQTGEISEEMKKSSAENTKININVFKDESKFP